MVKEKSNMKKIAVVLSGCGNKDGTEITEAVSLIVSLSQAGAELDFFAPNLEITPKNFVNDQPLPQKRNILTESARISRGKIRDLNNLKADDFDALAFPGGFGAALHLSNWAERGSQCTVLPSVHKAIEDFYGRKKPIAAVCIAPVLLARVLGHKHITITIGNDAETAAEIKKTGALHKNSSVTEHITDRENKIITTSAYMYGEAKPHEIFAGISGLAKELAGMA